MTDHNTNPDALARLHAENEAIEAAMQEAVNEAMLTHKQRGLPMVTWRDGQVVWVPPDRLPPGSSDAVQ
jgi:hypothetical protein